MTQAAATLVVGLSGFVALGYEILWYRSYSYVSGGSPRAFGVLLGAYLAGLAVGAWGSRRFCRDRSAAGDARARTLVAVFLLLANLAGFLAAPLLSLLVTRIHWAWSLPVVAVAAGMLGAVLPLVSHFAVEPDRRAGARVARLYVANIVGSAAGSLVMGFLLFDLLPYGDCARLLLAIGLAVAALLAWTGAGRARRRVAVAAVTLLAAGAAFGPALHGGFFERLLFKRAYVPGTRFAHLVENRHGVIAVTDDATVYGGGVYDGRISTDLVHDVNRIVRPFALCGFDREPRTVLVVGLSTGAWTRVLTSFPGIERITVVELNPGYLELIPRYPAVAGLLDDPRVEIVVDDGRRWIARHPERRFDLIVQNTTFHWRAHATNLLSLEYFGMCRARLEPGGMLVFNATSSDHAMRTALEAFPHGMRIGNNLLVATEPVRFDPSAWGGRLLACRLDGLPVLRADVPGDVEALQALVERARASLASPSAGSWLEPGDLLRDRLRDVEIVTDDNMRCEFPW